jgi:hypothetical protein
MIFENGNQRAMTKEEMKADSSLLAVRCFLIVCFGS